MTPEEVLKASLQAIRSFLLDQGFRARKGVFVRQLGGGNLLIVGHQKSRSSSKDLIEVTINGAVHSSRLDALLAGGVVDIWNGQWRTRYREEGEERWLSIDSGISVNESSRRLLRACEQVLAELILHATDEALRDAWLLNQGRGLTEAQRLLCLAVLLKDLGPAESLPGVLRALAHRVRGHSYGGVVRAQLAGIGLVLPDD